MNILPDEYEQLSTQLFQAAERETADAAASPARRRGVRSWFSRHTLLVAGIVLGLAGTATAAAVITTLTGEPSGPLDGVVRSSPAGEAAGRYRVRLTPSFAVGSSGWCSSTVVVDAPGGNYGGSGCGPAATTARHVIAGGMTGSDPGVTLLSLVVDDQVAGVRLPGGRVVLARADSSLPSPFRSVVTMLSPTEFDAINGGPGHPWTLLDRDGAEVTTPDERDTTQDVPDQPARTVTGLTPAGSPCAIGLTGEVPDLGRIQSRILNATPVATPTAAGDPLLACAATIFRDRTSSPLAATVLLDARDPGAPAPALPGATEPDAGGVAKTPVASPGFGSSVLPLGGTGTAQRRDHAWLVVQGGTPAEQRALLGHLTVTTNLN